MFRFLVPLFATLSLSQFAHATIIDLTFSVVPEVFGPQPPFYGHIIGDDKNGDNYLLFDELTHFSLAWSGDATTPAWSHGLTDLVPDEFLFTLARETYGDSPDGPFGDLPSLFFSSPGDPEILSLTTLGADGSYFRYTYGSDALEWGLPGRATFRGVAQFAVPEPPTLGVSILAMLILAGVRNRRV